MIPQEAKQASKQANKQAFDVPTELFLALRDGERLLVAATT